MRPIASHIKKKSYSHSLVLTDPNLSINSQGTRPAKLFGQANSFLREFGKRCDPDCEGTSSAQWTRTLERSKGSSPLGMIQV